ncbi:MAG: hypothetical protein QOC99_1239 [Acidobacteriota bacterium]|nr:hypothetical protein [Acidobacteriota bacterium]MDT7778727.1 hypothetical protein [Acidobacteriota bacterium]
MTIIDEDELFFAGENGETITVTVKSTTPPLLVNFDLDGQTGVIPSTGPQSGALTVKLDQSKHDPSTLTLVFHFPNASGGGLYKLIVTGSKGPTSFGTLIPQLNSKVTAAFLTFDVV